MRVYVAETIEEGWQTLIFEGNADKRLKAQIPEILDYITDKTMLDIGKLKSMDQDGIHGWLELVHSMDPDKTIFMCHCPSHFIDKVNLVPQLIDNLQVTSLYLPVNCTSCRGQFEILFDDFDSLNHEQADQYITDKKCPKCSEKKLNPIVDLKIFLGFYASTQKEIK